MSVVIFQQTPDAIVLYFWGCFYIKFITVAENVIFISMLQSGSGTSIVWLGKSMDLTVIGAAVKNLHKPVISESTGII